MYHEWARTGYVRTNRYVLAGMMDQSRANNAALQVAHAVFTYQNQMRGAGASMQEPNLAKIRLHVLHHYYSLG